MNKSEIPTAKVGYRHFKGIPEEIKVYKVLREKGIKGFFKPKPIKRKIGKRWIKWGITIFIILFIFIQMSEVNKQKEEKELFEQKVIQKEEEIQRKDIERKIEEISRDVEEAIRAEDKRRVVKGIDEMKRLNDEIGNLPEYDKMIRHLKEMQENDFNEEIIEYKK